MQIDRLLEIIILLLNKEKVTAKELSEKLGVSVRTIYRDIDTLSLAGIPVYSQKGYGGGVSLLKEFTLEKVLFSKEEQENVMFLLQSLKAVNFPDIDNALSKIGVLFKNAPKTNWIEVDFSHDYKKPSENKFSLLKEAILSKKITEFYYLNSYKEKRQRRVKPFKLFFKTFNWYLKAYCIEKEDIRVFRLTRIRNIILTDEIFNDILEEYDENNILIPTERLKTKLKFHPRMEYKVMDNFDDDEVTIDSDGYLIVETNYGFDDWVLGFVLSFGKYAEILEPSFAREIVKKEAQEISKIYDYKDIEKGL